MGRKYQLCTRCVMDTSAIDITFNDCGVCNYCTELLQRSAKTIFEDPEDRRQEREAFIKRVKASGQGKKYDCIVGVSGGVDSSWALVQAVRLGLRPLAVHMDNNWNTELSKNNINNIVRILGVDLHTHVLDWNEYRSLMQAFFDADVIDIELLYDNAMLAVNYQQANKLGLKFILSGSNQSTEGMRMPPGWNWYKPDKRQIKALSKRFANMHLKTFPAFGTLEYIYYRFAKKIEFSSFLDYFDYNKFDALNNLERDFGYIRYPYKHYESIFTRFYQGYLLPKKYGVDKRRHHLSTLVVTGQLSRDEALKDLERIPYPTLEEQEADVDYFLAKMGWTKQQLSTYLARAPKSHSDYPSEKSFRDLASKIYRNIYHSHKGS